MGVEIAPVSGSTGMLCRVLVCSFMFKLFYVIKSYTTSGKINLSKCAEQTRPFGRAQKKCSPDKSEEHLMYLLH